MLIALARPTAAEEPRPVAPAPVMPAAPAWESFPAMFVERVYRGPLKDTIIQRWRDPVDGSVCYVYTPISSPFLQQTAGNPYAQYGPNSVGSISCVHPAQIVQLPPANARGR